MFPKCHKSCKRLSLYLKLDEEPPDIQMADVAAAFAEAPPPTVGTPVVAKPPQPAVPVFEVATATPAPATAKVGVVSKPKPPPPALATAKVEVVSKPPQPAPATAKVEVVSKPPPPPPATAKISIAVPKPVGSAVESVEIQD